MRVIFLDFDGVLNSRAWVDRHLGKDRPVELLDEAAVRRVEALSVCTGAVIVITSTWRVSHSLLQLTEMLRAKGLATADVIDVTPMIPHKRGRGEEIQRWLDSVPKLRKLEVEAMVILDDEPDMLHLAPHLVLTSFESGLTDAHLATAREHLLGSSRSV